MSIVSGFLAVLLIQIYQKSKKIMLKSYKRRWTRRKHMLDKENK